MTKEKDDPRLHQRTGSGKVRPEESMRGKRAKDDESRVDLLSEERHRDSDGDSKKKDALPQKSDLKGDYINVCLLLFLYVLQGIPLGLSGSIPLILQNRRVSYGQQAIFSFVNWPFSVKLLWAPIVDSIYSNRFGRRKSWLVPVQYLIGLFMIVLSWSVGPLLGDEREDIVIPLPGAHPTPANATDPKQEPIIPIIGPQIYILTGVFLVLNFLAATQDIAVDGWALTMLKRKNVGYASTCNTVGQTAGYFLGNVVFLALESSEFCNRFLRSVPQKEGLVDLSGFLYFWGIVFFVTTTLVMIIKQETDSQVEEEEEYGVIKTYQMLYRILRLPAVQMFALILLTCKMGFAVTDSVTGLKLMENGIHKEHLALLAVPLVPLQVILPWVISRYTAGPRPLDVFLKAYPYRLGFGVVFAGLLYWTKYVRNPVDGSFPFYYFVVIVIAYGAHQITLYSMYVALMAFHAKTSDPAIGGTYMTLLNTVTNLGGNWPATISLYLVDYCTFRSCSCAKTLSYKECEHQGGACEVTVDGYYVEVVLCMVVGLLWLQWGKRRVTRLQTLSSSAWKCP